MVKIRLLGILTLVVAFVGAASVAHAFIAYEVQPGTTGNQSFTGALGMDFDANVTTTITALGVFDSAGDGLGGSFIVQLFDRTITAVPNLPLAAIEFTPADPGTPIGGSLFKDLVTPLVLPPGFQGSIVGTGFWGTGSLDDRNGNTGGAAATQWTTNDAGGRLSFVGESRWGLPGELVANPFPTHGGGGPANRFAAGTFAYTPVPEPATLLLIGSGLVGIGVGARRRNRK
jgi:hypothetical protein